MTKHQSDKWSVNRWLDQSRQRIPSWTMGSSNIIFKKASTFPKSVMIEPWAIDIELTIGDELTLIIQGLTNQSDVLFEHTADDRLVVFSQDIESVDVVINGVDLSYKYLFK